MSSNQRKRPREGDISSRPPKRSRLMDSTREASEDDPEEHEGQAAEEVTVSVEDDSSDTDEYSDDENSEITVGDDYGIAEEIQQERNAEMGGNYLCHHLPLTPEEDERRGNEVRSFTIICPICMDDYSEIVQSGRIITSTKCGHLFCCCCLDRALENEEFCPVCKKRVICQECHPVYI